MSEPQVSPVNLDVRQMAKELEIARRKFSERGESVVSWAVARGFNPVMVHGVLNGSFKCARGQAHQIAVELGLKPSIPTKKVA